MTFCVQVTYDDGEIELGVEPCRLRKPEEADRAAMGGTRAATGPDWEHLAVRPAMGVRVAVHGYSEAQVSKLVVGIIGGKSSALVLEPERPQQLQLRRYPTS